MWGSHRETTVTFLIDWRVDRCRRVGSGVALGVGLEDRDMISSARTDAELMLAANVGLEHIETYIDRRVDLSPNAESALWLLGWTHTDRRECRRAVGELLARAAHDLTTGGYGRARMTLSAFRCPVEPLRAAICSLTIAGCTAMRPPSRSRARGGRTMASARRAGCGAQRDYLLHRALVAGRRVGSGVFLSAVSAARTRAIPRTGVCLEDGGQTPLEGIHVQPRFVLGPAVDAEGHIEGAAPAGHVAPSVWALVWAAVAHG
jgi:hypothetical protein